MSSLSLAALAAAACARPLELRVDVSRPAQHVRDELLDLARRLARAAQHATAPPGMRLPDGFRARERQADGESYVYVEHLGSQRLVGYVAFQRLPEAGRRAATCVRLPHALFHPDFQRRGLGTAVYGGMLARGVSLVSGARQSPGAHALWQALGRRHALAHIQVGRRQLAYLGEHVPEHVRDDLQTRLLLLPIGWSITRFARHTGMLCSE